MESTDGQVLVDQHLVYFNGNRCLQRTFETRPIDFFRDY